MSCELKIQVTVIDPETKKPKLTDISLGTVDVDSEGITFDTVLDQLMKASPELREDISNLLDDARSIPLNDQDLENHQIVGNTTIGGIFKAWPSLSRDFDMESFREEKLNILRCSNLTLNTVSYSGRVLTSDGREVFVIKDFFGAKHFLEYLTARNAVKDAFERSPNIPEAVTPYIEGLEAVANQYGMDVTDVLLKYLDNKNSFTPFKKGKIIYTPRQILGDVIAILTNKYNTDHKYTPLELGLLGNSDITEDYTWNITKEDFYNTLSVYYPNFAEAVSLEAFNSMSQQEVEKILLGPEGLFHGNPLLSVAEIKVPVTGSLKTKQPESSTKTQFVSISKKDIKQSWEIITQQAKESLPNETIPTYEDFAKLSPKDQCALFNKIKFTVLEPSTGDNCVVQAVMGKTTSGRDAVYYSYTYEKAVTPKASQPDPTIVLKFPFTSIGATYDFGYDTMSVFSPVADNDVVHNGMYKGMYVYKAVIPNAHLGNQTVYAISRNIISPRTVMRTYASLDAALYGVEQCMNTDTLWNNSLMSLKNNEGVPRTCKIEMEHVRDGQIITTLDIPDVKIPNVELKTFPIIMQQVLGMTVTDFHETFNGIEDITKLDTPEKATVFMSLLFDGLESDELSSVNACLTIDDFTILMRSPKIAERIKSIIGTITSPEVKTKSYYVENTFTKNNDKFAILKLLDKNGTSVRIDGSAVGDININDYIGQVMDNAIKYFKDTYKININKLSTSELIAFSKEHGLGIENKVDSVKAFIYDNAIYIHTSKAKASDLYHEMAHLFLGIVKAKSPDSYVQLLENYQQNKRFKSKFSWISKTYKGLAMQDILEESVVDLIAEDLFRDNRLSVDFNPGVFNEVMNKIVTTIDSFKSEMAEKGGITNGLGFTNLMQSWFSDKESMDKLKVQRQIANFIQSKLGKEIIENCK